MKKVLFICLLALPFLAFGQGKSLGAEVRFMWQGDTMDTRYLEPFLVQSGYEPLKAWATRRLFVDKCSLKDDEVGLVIFDSMMRDNCGKGLADYYIYFWMHEQLK